MALTPFTLTKIVFLGTSVVNYTWAQGRNKESLIAWAFREYGITVAIDNLAVPGSNTTDMLAAVEGGVLAPYIGDSGVAIVMAHGINDYVGGSAGNWDGLSTSQQNLRIYNLTTIHQYCDTNGLRLIQCAETFVNYQDTTIDNDPTARVNELARGLYTYNLQWIVPIMQTFTPQYLQDIGGGMLWPMIDCYNEIRNEYKTWPDTSDLSDIIHPGASGRLALGLCMLRGAIEISLGTAPAPVTQRNFNTPLPAATNEFKTIIALGRDIYLNSDPSNINKQIFPNNYVGDSYDDTIVDVAGVSLPGLVYFSDIDYIRRLGLGNTSDPTDVSTSLNNNNILKAAVGVDGNNYQFNNIISGLEPFAKYSYQLCASADTGAASYVCTYQWAGEVAADFRQLDAATDEGQNNRLTGVLETDYLGRAKLIVREENLSGKSLLTAIELDSTVNLNTAPVALAGSDKTAFIGNTVIFDGSNSTDPEADALTFVWVLDSAPVGNTAVINNATSAICNIIPDVAGTYVLSLVVNDGELDSPPDTVNLVVSAPNVEPVANAGPDQVDVDPNTVIYLDGTASNDPDGSIVSYSWVQIGGNIVTINDANTANASFTSPNLLTPSTIVMRLTVVDNDGASTFDTVTITVLATTPANQLPVANAGADMTDVPHATEVTLNFSGSYDNDGTIVGYQVTQTAGDTVTLDTSALPLVTFTTPTADEDQRLTFSLIVEDDDGDFSPPDTVNIDVLAKTKFAINLNLSQVPDSRIQDPLVYQELLDLRTAIDTLRQTVEDIKNEEP